MSPVYFALGRSCLLSAKRLRIEMSQPQEKLLAGRARLKYCCAWTHHATNLEAGTWHSLISDKLGGVDELRIRELFWVFNLIYHYHKLLTRR